MASQRAQPTACKLSQLAAHPEILLAKTIESSSVFKEVQLCGSFLHLNKIGLQQLSYRSYGQHPEILLATTHESSSKFKEDSTL